MTMLRVFFALWPGIGARDQTSALARIVAEQANGRAPPSENLHLTLAFVGDVAAGSVAKLCKIGEAASASAAPFTLTLDRIGMFRRTGIAWGGATAAPAELMCMAQSLTDALAAQEFPIERRAFEPHVTLARRCRKPCRLLAPGAPIAWTVSRIALNASEQVRGRPRYRELGGWPVAGGRES